MMEQMDNVVDTFSDEEMEDYAAVFTQIINDLCRFADKYNYDRDNIMAYTAERFSLFAEITTVENLVLKEQPAVETETAKNGDWIMLNEDAFVCTCCHKASSTTYYFCPECGAQMDISHEDNLMGGKRMVIGNGKAD